MKELGITKGEWRAKGKSVNISGEKMRRVSGPEGQSMHSMTLNQERREADAKLIADAGTTANKCNLLPSELLQLYNEAIEVLGSIMKACKNEEIELLMGDYVDAQKVIEKHQEQTISKAKRE